MQVPILVGVNLITFMLFLWLILLMIWQGLNLGQNGYSCYDRGLGKSIEVIIKPLVIN